MRALCDLHTHSTCSDGSYTPTAIIEEALSRRLSAVALCDHNTVDGLPEFLRAGEGKPIEAVAGAEFSVDYEGKELHLLGLFLPTEAFAQIAAIMAQVNAKKEQSNLALVASLGHSGYHVDYAAIKAASPKGTVNRVHIAKELVRQGYLPSVDHAMNTLLSEKAGHYVPPQRLTVWEMLDTLCAVHAAPVLAHPLLNLSETQLNAFLPRAKAHGLIGMECAYSEYDTDKTATSLVMAKAYGILPSGGSDFHGENKPHIGLGIGTGRLQVPYDWALAIKNSIQ